jgi:hypothetical protein
MIRDQKPARDPGPFPCLIQVVSRAAVAEKELQHFWQLELGCLCRATGLREPRKTPREVDCTGSYRVDQAVAAFVCGAYAMTAVEQRLQHVSERHPHRERKTMQRNGAGSGCKSPSGPYGLFCSTAILVHETSALDSSGGKTSMDSNGTGLSSKRAWSMAS